MFLSSGPRIREQSQHDDSIQRLANSPHYHRTHGHATPRHATPHHITITAGSGRKRFYPGTKYRSCRFLRASRAVLGEPVQTVSSHPEVSAARYFPGVVVWMKGRSGCLHLTPSRAVPTNIYARIESLVERWFCLCPWAFFTLRVPV